MEWILGGAVVLALVAWLVTRSVGRRRPANTSSLRRRLRTLTHDPDVAERLVVAERKRHPELDERAVLRRVIHRLERDRGR